MCERGILHDELLVIKFGTIMSQTLVARAVMIVVNKAAWHAQLRSHWIGMGSTNNDREELKMILSR